MVLALILPPFPPSITIYSISHDRLPLITIVAVVVSVVVAAVVVVVILIVVVYRSV